MIGSALCRPLLSIASSYMRVNLPYMDVKKCLRISFYSHEPSFIPCVGMMVPKYSIAKQYCKTTEAYVHFHMVQFQNDRNDLMRYVRTTCAV